MQLQNKYMGRENQNPNAIPVIVVPEGSHLYDEIIQGIMGGNLMTHQVSLIKEQEEPRFSTRPLDTQRGWIDPSTSRERGRR